MFGTSFRAAWGWFWRWLRWIILTPVFAACVTVLIVAAGCLVSLYADDIKGAWPLRWHARGPISPPALWSWAVGGVAAIAFFVRQAFDQQERDLAQVRLVDRAKELEKLVRTMPPAKFLASFADLCSAVDDVAEAGIVAARDNDLDTVEQSARAALSALAGLARIFDGDHPHRYAANVMIFLPSEGMSPEVLAGVQKRLKFCEENVSVASLLGVLDLKRELSATSSDDNPDDRIIPFALPVPKTHKDGGKYKVLPGAPRAFVDNEPDIHFDFDQLLKWCDDEADLTKTVKRQMGKYFDEQKSHLQSFISIPLSDSFRDEPTDPEPSPFGVLNVHCGQPGLLRREPEAVGNFVMISRPLLINIVKLVRIWQEIPRTTHTPEALQKEPASSTGEISIAG